MATIETINISQSCKVVFDDGKNPINSLLNWTDLEPFNAPAHLTGCRLMRASVIIGERPIERGDVNAASSLAH